MEIALAEVDEILKQMDKQYQNRIPKKLRELIADNKEKNCNIVIIPNVPLTEQNISRKALSILSVINYNYWCIEEEQKERIIEKYKKNWAEKQEKLIELYNPNKIFENQRETYQTIKEDKPLIVCSQKENLVKKFIDKIKKLLKLT